MYAGEQYGAGGVYASGGTSLNPVKQGGLSTEHAAAMVVLGSLAALILIRRGFLPISTGRLTGGLVK
jgi:hypothetical protein